MTSGPAIYEIRHVTSQKVYVGSTNSWKRRLAEHKAALRGGRHCNAHLQNAWSKHGEADFAFSVIEHLQSTARIAEREQYWIDALKAADAGFNMCPAAGTTRGLPCSEEKKAKLSLANTGRVRTKEARALIRAARATQTITPESSAKTRAANTGKKRSSEFRALAAAWMTGRDVSAETRAKIANANLGKKASPETRAKMAASAVAARARRKADRLTQMSDAELLELIEKGAQAPQLEDRS